MPLESLVSQLQLAATGGPRDDSHCSKLWQRLSDGAAESVPGQLASALLVRQDFAPNFLQIDEAMRTIEECVRCSKFEEFLRRALDHNANDCERVQGRGIDRIRRNVRLMAATARLAHLVGSACTWGTEDHRRDEWDGRFSEACSVCVEIELCDKPRAPLNPDVVGVWDSGIGDRKISRIEDPYRVEIELRKCLGAAAGGVATPWSLEWTLEWWNAARRAGRRGTSSAWEVDMPVAFVAGGEGRIARFNAVRLRDTQPGGALIEKLYNEEEQSAVSPMAYIGPDFLDSISAAWVLLIERIRAEEESAGHRGLLSAAWSLLGERRCDGPSAGAAIATAFNLLARWERPRQNILVMAKLEADGGIGNVGFEPKKAAEFRNHVEDKCGRHPRFLVTHNSPVPDGEPCADLNEIAEKTSTVPREALRSYLEQVYELVDKDLLPYLASGGKSRLRSKLYVSPRLIQYVPAQPDPEMKGDGQDPRKMRRSPAEDPLGGGAAGDMDSLYGSRHDREARAIPWDSLMRERSVKSLALLGPPGQGKTTLALMTARKLALDALRDLTRSSREHPLLLPVFLSLRNLTRFDLLEALRAPMESGGAGASDEVAEYIESTLDQGHVFLIDGLDEVEDKIRQHVDALIQTLRSRNASIILTSRPHTSRSGPFLSLKEYHLAPMSLPERKQFLENWYLDDPSPNRDRAVDLLKRDQIAKMAENPYLMSMILKLSDERAVDLSNLIRTEVYGEIVKSILSTPIPGLDNPAGIDPLVSREQMRLLESVSFQCFLGESTRARVPSLKLGDAIDAFYEGQTRRTATIPLIEELVRRRIIAKCGAGNDTVYVFPHRSIYEYLVAANLAGKVNRRKGETVRVPIPDEAGESVEEADIAPLDFASAAAWLPDYREVCIFLAGLLDEPDKWIDKLLNAEEDDILQHRTQLAAACLEELAPKFVE